MAYGTLTSCHRSCVPVSVERLVSICFVLTALNSYRDFMKNDFNNDNDGVFYVIFIE